ncbi:hypothetical protein TI39_contig348g00034 [Zymoseptoria brevis]|uniref:C2H2-type domain-containing protein n=1 Tax=Zymoseptoria brevis TaxID=1047168 RepID=A0A0F4GS87_9PEZI|nr:hypothetical protein TI39_contig348g00034 [Zymoseptoria brevis]
MDSPSSLQYNNPPRSRASSYLTSPHSSTADHRGAIHKRSYNDRPRSISTLQADRLYHQATDQADHIADLNGSNPLSNGDIRWITPQHSPQLTGFTTAPPIDPYPLWTAPTPPQSDSGLPTVSFDANEEPATCAPSDFFRQPTAEMSSLGYLLPSQYGNSPYDSDASTYAMDQNYIPPMRVSQPTTSAGSSAYAQQTTSSNPSLYQSRGPEPRRHSELPVSSGVSAYDPYRRISSPYDGQTNSNYSMPPTQTIPSISGLAQSPLPSPHLSSSGAQLSPQYTTRSPSLYENTNLYNQQNYTTAAPSATQLYSTSHRYPPPPFIGSNTSETPGRSKSGSISSNNPNDPSVRVLNQRPKPQCWEHGCNGRQFSTFSNLLRHQREKSGTANKSYCPKCNAEFTRTTAMHGHLKHDKCTKQRRESDAN